MRHPSGDPKLDRFTFLEGAGSMIVVAAGVILLSILIDPAREPEMAPAAACSFLAGIGIVWVARRRARP
jgi:hypothetical protein